MLIIIQDENQAILTAFEKILERENYETSTHSDSKEIFPVLSRQKAGAIFLELKRPDDSSSKTIQQLKKRYENLPIIIMTANSNVITEQYALKLGADVYLKKPFDVQDMLFKLKKLINAPPDSQPEKLQ